MEQYQTRWVRGKADGNGVRECADRYEIIKSVAKQFNRPFTVLDIGANLGYFSFRLMEDFDNCHAVMVEGHPTYARQLTELAGINGQGIVLTKSLTQGDLGLLGDVEHFDLVLAMSVVHHINGDVDGLNSDISHRRHACGWGAQMNGPRHRAVISIPASCQFKNGWLTHFERL